MPSEEDLRKIKEYEKLGINVVVLGSDGKIDYSTQGMCGEFCDRCSALRLLPDPDPYDWFRDEDMKAVCSLMGNAVIRGSLETPSEYTGIPKPLYCPKLGRELSEEEKKEAAEQLRKAQEYNS